ncbi:MAG: DUF6174 domain-containing protein [Acidimicrobiia bacterium]
MGKLGRLWVVFALLLGACSDGAESDLETAENRWKDSDVTDYEMQVRLACFCPPDVSGPFDITVRNEEVNEVQFGGVAIEPTGATPTMAFTVEGLFGIVRENLSADELAVTYDDDLGYPTLIEIDEDAEAVDDEWRVSATLVAP